MNNSIVINLREAGQVNPGRWLTGPLRVIQLVTVGPTEQVDLGPEVAVTLPLGTHVTVVAGQAGLEYSRPAWK